MLKNPQRLEKVSADRIDAINARLKEWGITREQMAKQLTNQPRCPYSATTLMKYAARGQGSHALTCFVESHFRYRKLRKKDLDLHLAQKDDLVVIDSFDRPFTYKGVVVSECEKTVFRLQRESEVFDLSYEYIEDELKVSEIYLVYPPLNQD